MARRPHRRARRWAPHCLASLPPDWSPQTTARTAPDDPRAASAPCRPTTAPTSPSRASCAPASGSSRLVTPGGRRSSPALRPPARPTSRAHPRQGRPTPPLAGACPGSSSSAASSGSMPSAAPTAAATSGSGPAAQRSGARRRRNGDPGGRTNEPRASQDRDGQRFTGHYPRARAGSDSRGPTPDTPRMGAPRPNGSYPLAGRAG